MGYHSPLVVGQVIYPSEASITDVWNYALENNKQEDNFLKGLLCEYAHNEVFDALHWAITETRSKKPYDRVYAGLKQDDKLATFIQGRLCKTHTISYDEFHHWRRCDEPVIIHSFEETKDGGSRYCGPICFHRFLAKGVFIYSEKNHNYFFNRAVALEIAGL